MQAADATGKFVVYVSVGEDKQIALYNLDPANGKLTEAGRTQLAAGPGAMAIDAKQQRLYAALRSANSVGTFEIDPTTGALKQLGTTPVAGNPVYLSVDRSGKHLLTAYYTGDKAAIYPIDKDGTVASAATQVLSLEKNPHSIVIDKSNRYVFVPNCGSDSIMHFKFDAATGKLTPNDPPKTQLPAGEGPRHVVFAPREERVYFVNEKGSSVSGFTLDHSQGVPAIIQTISTLPADFKANNTCADIHITPDGKYLYASNRGHDSIAGYAIDANGHLTSLGQTPTEKTPRDFAIDPTGSYLIAAGQGSGKLATYRIDSANGKLERLATYDVGKGPAWVEVIRLN